MKSLIAFLRRFGTILVPLLAVGALVTILLMSAPQPSRPQAEGEVWTCSMHPQVRLPNPGRCPICGMTLIPVKQLQSEQTRVQQQAGLETETVRYRELSKEVRTVGKLDYNERRVAYLTARVAGRVDRVYADFVGIHVNQNDHLVDIYSPELYSAQQELIQALAAEQQGAGARGFATSNLDSVRTKLRLLGILPEQIAEIERTRKVQSHLTVFAPIGGIVVEKNIREGQYVDAGDSLYRIAELDPIWLYLDIYEYDLSWIQYGEQVEVTVEAYPGEVFTGHVVFLDPFLNDDTRTVRVRVNLANPDLRLKPAMYASATIRVRLQADGRPQPTGLEGKYLCPMHPEIVLDAAGNCSICGMPLERIPEVFPRSPITDVMPASLPGDVAAPMTGELHELHAAHDPPAVTGGDKVAPGAAAPPGSVLAVRKTAVLDTGRRQVVYRRRSDGAYELVDVKLGPLAQGADDAGQTTGYFPVLAGLQAEDAVVIQGGFLLDSQRQFEGMPSLLYTEGRSAASLHAGHGGVAAPAQPTPSGMPSGHQR